MAMTDTHMEELVEQAAEMAPDGGAAQLGVAYRGEALLAPDTDFLTDDRSSANSGMEVGDRLTYLEQRVQMQEDDIQLLKMALADVLKRLNISEEQTAALNRKGHIKAARPVSLASPSRPSTSTSASSTKKSSMLPPTSTLKNYTPPSVSKSGVRSPGGSGTDSPGGAVSSRARTSTTMTTGKKLPDGKPKETTASVAVTMQIFLSPLSRRTGSPEMAGSMAIQPNAYPPASGPPPGKPQARKTPAFTLPLQKSVCQSHYFPLDATRYKSPIKSPSQYFQICY